jgi:hypothetical protein
VLTRVGATAHETTQACKKQSASPPFSIQAHQNLKTRNLKAQQNNTFLYGKEDSKPQPWREIFELNCYYH